MGERTWCRICAETERHDEDVDELHSDSEEEDRGGVSWELEYWKQYYLYWVGVERILV